MNATAGAGVATTHIVGGGLAGLACAVRLCKAGIPVVLYEAAGSCGGRCRSFYDETLDAVIDNGNHLLLAGNRSAMAYLREIGAAGSFGGPDEAALPFIDLETGGRWTVRINDGRFPWWLFVPSRRVPGSGALDYLQALRLANAGAATVAQCLDRGSPAYRGFWEPLSVAVLNTEADSAAACLMWPVMVEIFARGGAAARPLIAREGLSASLVDPALRLIDASGGRVHYHRRLVAVDRRKGRAVALRFTEDEIALGADDKVVLALPSWSAVDVLDGIAAPHDHRPIVNAHFRMPDSVPPAPEPWFVGLLGGAAQWVFRRGGLASVTVSAATEFVDQNARVLAARLWQDIARAFELSPSPVPPCRIVKERRATFAQTPASLSSRPGPKTEIANVLIAGDWTATGLPATIEGAVRSGQRAAALAQDAMRS